MIAPWLLIAAVHAADGVSESRPAAVIVATPRGIVTVPVDEAAGYPTLPVTDLQRVLPLTTVVEGGWVEVAFARQAFRFLLNAPLLVYRNEFRSLVGGAYLRDGVVFVPMQWLVGMVPRLFSENYRYDAVAARFEEVGMTPVATRTSAPGVRVPEAAARMGLRLPHKVVVDAGHGGNDPGTRGRYLPQGVQEKHVALAIAKVVETELLGRGVEVIMTRRTDVLIPLETRGPMCGADCDLFVSIHVNSLPDSRANRRIRGVETYFWREGLTADAERVAAMENESLRYQDEITAVADDDPLNFILKDLERNEYLRESADAADVLHGYVSETHPAGSRRLAQADFVVLRFAVRPAVLVETGYGSNRDDARFLSSRAGQRRVATAIADGIIEYLRRYEDRTLSSLPPR